MRNLFALLLIMFAANFTYAQIDLNKGLNSRQPKAIAPSNMVYECGVVNPINIHTSFDTSITRPRVGGMNGTLSFRVFVLNEKEYVGIASINGSKFAFFLLENRRILNGGYELYDIKMSACPQSVLDFLNPRMLYFHPYSFCYAICSEFGVVTYGNIPALSAQQLGYQN